MYQFLFLVVSQGAAGLMDRHVASAEIHVHSQLPEEPVCF